MLIGRIKSIQSKEDYVKVLRIFYGYFAPLEKLIRQQITESNLPDLNERRNVSKIADDLRLLGHDEPMEYSPVLPEIDNHFHAVGAMYVQEGSTLGGRHIARMISSKLGNASEALTFFHGYNEKTEEKWKNFKAFLNSNFTTESEQGQVIDGAKRTFEKMQVWILQSGN